MKKIIGKKYKSFDNSYEVNLTQPVKLIDGKFHKNRPFLCLNDIVCTILTQPFFIKVFLGLPNKEYTTVKMILVVTPEGECISQLFSESSIIN